MGTMTQCKIDWMTLTKVGRVLNMCRVESSLDAIVVAKIMLNSLNLPETGWERDRADRFYTFCYTHPELHMTLGIPDNLEKQGVRLVVPGRACQYPGEVEALAAAARDNKWKFTRIDVACDIQNEAVDYDELENALHMAYPNRRRTLGRISGKTGDTLNIGKRTSENYCRIYDKGRQQRSPRPWIRLELEMKGDTALALGAMPGSLLRNAVAHFIAWSSDIKHWTFDDFRGWYDGDPEKVKLPSKAETDRSIWFENTVASAMLKWAQDEPEQARRWVENMSTMLDILTSM